MCQSEFGFLPNVVRCRRLGQFRSGHAQPVLTVLQTVDEADYYVAHYVWPYHETVRMSVCPSVCLSVTCHISKTEPDRAIVTMDHYIEVGCN